MTREIVVANQDGGQELPWGKAHPLRGANYEETACRFLRDYPIGSRLSSDAFGNWAQRRGLIDAPQNVSIHSRTWKAYVRDRSYLRHKINRAAAHPRMDTPFVIVVVTPGLLMVCALHDAIGKDPIMDRIESLFETRKREIAYKFQSIDWSSAAPSQFEDAKSIFEDLDNIRDQIDLQARHFRRKIDRLESKMRKAIEGSRSVPT